MTKLKGSKHETLAIDNCFGNVRLWVRITGGGVCDTASGRDPPLAIDSVWRDTDILGLADRH